ncbi:hypothetical protein, variant [Verruconis gallopava]|uniref:Gylcosyl hydrolase 115 C-terminal domain-containing protein n=1 Tax=Verruconis gallopava TaxID=253628 RepID=A0A0D2A4M1_9PEZI|nr:hypothetical protein, variant [Verruconis gallopava]KIW01733.1 hypothetical protein, variant [Verruconis gallopava]
MFTVHRWHWWADVPVKKHSSIYALPVSSWNGEPSIKYRGIFINDESPAMDSWAQEKFGPVFNSRLYEHIFELLLRLKANFMWPAMWRGYPYPGRSFFVDDPDNQALADRYGIVVGTSHHEPMQRAMNEWSTTQPEGTWNWKTNRKKITNYFKEGVKRAVPYESMLTMGMRGEGDGPISDDNPIETLTDIIRTQREIIKEHHEREDGVPQLMALYKEVQQYYDDGLEIPDDVTLLFSDDNFGSLRRLPTVDEGKRTGGSGIYYHFEYTGGPRSYRWINSNTLGKVWQQLQLAYYRNAKKIWIFNVGDLKPMEIPMSFAFDLAWNIRSIRSDSLLGYFQALASREFGEEFAKCIGHIWQDYDRLLALRKHEHIVPETFSLLDYHEAENVISRWERLLNEAESIHAKCTDRQRPSIFQLVLHPIKASYIYTLLRVTQSKNRLYGKQRRNTTNRLFYKCIRLFEDDHELSEQYHRLLGGKWNHILRQPHYGYTGWEGPSRDMIGGLCYVQTRANSNPSVGHMGIAVEGTEGVHPGAINEDSDRTHPSRGNLRSGVTVQLLSPYGPKTRYFEIYHRGTIPFSWRAKPQYSWIKLDKYEGELSPDDNDTRVTISIDWDDVPQNLFETAYIEVIGTVDGYEKVVVPVRKQYAPDDFTGFVESAGYVSIDAGNWVEKPYMLLPSMGRPLAGSVTLPNEINFGDIDSVPFLRYNIFTFSEHENAVLELQFNMTLDTDTTGFMEYDFRWDGGQVHTFRLTEDEAGGLPKYWDEAVQDCVWKKNHTVGRVRRGEHTIEVKLKAANMCLEKVVLNIGGLRPTYLGPSESHFVEGLTEQMLDIDGRDKLHINMTLQET